MKVAADSSGGSLCCAAYLASALALNLLFAKGSDAIDWLSAIATGKRTILITKEDTSEENEKRRQLVGL